MKPKTYALLSAVFGLAFLTRSAVAEPSPQFDNSAPPVVPAGAPQAGPGGATQQLSNMTAPTNITPQAHPVPPPVVERRPSDGPSLLSTIGGVAVGVGGVLTVGVLVGAAALSPVGWLGLGLVGAGAGAAFLGKNKLVGATLAGAGVGALAAAGICAMAGVFCPPAAVVAGAVIVGGAAYFAAKNFLS